MISKDETNPFISENEFQGFAKLCSELSSYINTTNTNCSSVLSRDVALMKNENTDFRDLTPNLVSDTGTKFYISSIIVDDIANTERSYYNPANPDYTLRFYMVYVDLSGSENDKMVHSVAYNPTQNPSVYAFAVIPTGEAIPVGIAEYNIKYLASRIAYRNGSDILYSQLYSFREAKHTAWNLYNTNSQNLTFLEHVSFTYNDYIKEILLRNGSKLYNFNSSANFPESFSSPVLEFCQSDGVVDNYSKCSVKVDTPKYKY